MSKLLEILQQIAAGTVTPEEAEREIHQHWHLLVTGNRGEIVNCDAIAREKPSARIVHDFEWTMRQGGTP